MGKQYTRQEILEMCDRAMDAPGLFYQRDFLNYTGQCRDGKEFYTEIVAEYLLNHLSTYMRAIRFPERESSYYMPGHDGRHDPRSRRREEVIAMQMFNACRDGGGFPKIGRIIDYQTPLKNTEKNDGQTIGKIDLLAWDGETLRLLELKQPKSGESMLRCVLEGFTYLKAVNAKKLIADFNEGLGLDIPADAKVRACPLVFEYSIPHKTYLRESSKLRRLMQHLGSEVFVLRETAGGYTVI